MAEARCTGSTLRAIVPAEGIGSMSTGELRIQNSERRRAPRYDYQAFLEIEWGSARLKARTRDISAGGMFIEAEDVLWVGAGFRARMAMESPFWLDCLVKRVEPGRGMGVTVELREDHSQRHYQDLLAKLAAHQ
jgi:PilZ domain-containing protein